MGLRPAPALRWYFRPGSRLRAGISGSTLLHKLSETVHDLIWAILSPSSPLPIRCKREIQPHASNSSLFTDKLLAPEVCFSRNSSAVSPYSSASLALRGMRPHQRSSIPEDSLNQTIRLATSPAALFAAQHAPAQPTHAAHEPPRPPRPFRRASEPPAPT